MLLAPDARRARPNQEPKDQGAKKTMNQGSKEPMNVLAYMLIERYSTRRALRDYSFQCGCHKEGRLNNLQSMGAQHGFCGIKLLRRL